jgi:hypothetical protein
LARLHAIPEAHDAIVAHTVHLYIWLAEHRGEQWFDLPGYLRALTCLDHEAFDQKVAEATINCFLEVKKNGN